MNGRLQNEWTKSKRHGHYLTVLQDMRAAVVSLGRRRYGIYAYVSGDEENGYRGDYLTWRPTLREAKDRASWADRPDLMGADDQYNGLSVVE